MCPHKWRQTVCTQNLCVKPPEVLRAIASESALEAFPFHSVAVNLVFVLGRFLSSTCLCRVAPSSEF